jgi:hypothetical protein
MIKYRRAILFTEIWPLPVYLGWIMAFPEDLEKITIAYAKRIKGNLYRFSMTGIVTADITIIRAISMPSTVTNPSRNNPRQNHESVFHTPETTGRKGGNFNQASPPVNKKGPRRAQLNAT